jgi:hypothetical protein
MDGINEIEYKEYIRSLASQDKNVVFFNSGPEQAAFVLSTMFEHAKNDVKIYAGNFAGNISSQKNYKDGLQKFLRTGGRLRILLQQDKFGSPSKEPEIFELLRFFSVIKPEQISIKMHPFRVTRGEGTPEMHFAVADDKMYRLEEDIEKFRAVCNFNDKEVVQKLSKLFDEIYSDPHSVIFPL